MKTLKQKAQRADGARKCGKCHFFKGGLAMCSAEVLFVCTKSYQDGYIKGYKEATNDGKQEYK